jgi:hypothetical protein
MVKDVIMKNLYNFYWDCGRMGSLDGLFVATPEEVAASIGREAYFGEVLGKHSEISGTVLKDHITLVSDDQHKVEWLVEVTGGNPTINGFNPLEYIEEDYIEDEYEDYLPEDDDNGFA